MTLFHAPVCVFHGLPLSEHQCLVCALCYKDLTPENCNRLPDGTLEDVCRECAVEEKLVMVKLDASSSK